MRFAAIVAAALAAAPAAGEVLTESECGALWAMVEDIDAVEGRIAAGQIVLRDGWCSITDVEFRQDGQYAPGMSFGRLSWRGEGLDAFARRFEAPAALEVRIEDARYVLQTGDAAMDYMFRAQSAPHGIDAEVSLTWDKAARQFVVQRLDIDFPGENAIALTARVGNVDLTSKAALQASLGSFALTDMTLEVTTNGLFETYALIPIGSALLSGAADPEAEIAALLADAKAAVAELPASSFDAATKAALTTILSDLPNPAGRISLAMRSDAGIGPARVAQYAMSGVPTTIADLAPVFDGVTVTATYDRTAGGTD
mgnify:FL=1